MLVLDIYFKIELKDSLVDMLLEGKFDDFFYFHCSKYAASSFLKSTKEQVSGRQEYGLFKLIIKEEEISIAQKIHDKFGETNIYIYSAAYQKV